MKILVFGDQTADQYPLLQKIALIRDNSIASAFVERIGTALREEARRLPHASRQSIPNFLDLSGLLEAYHEKGCRVPELEAAFLTIAQLAYYITYFEDQPHDIPNLDEVLCVSLCTGSIAAAAVMSSNSLCELLPLAVEAVRIAFRIGTCVDIARESLDQDKCIGKNWSTIITEIDEQTAKSALEEFHSKLVLDVSTKAYISAVSNTTVTISGPPATTKLLFQTSKAIRGKSLVPISVYAPYHAPHLFNEENIEFILNRETQAVLQGHLKSQRMLSAATGKHLLCKTPVELFKCVLNEMLCHPVRWNSVLKELVSDIQNSNWKKCQVFAVGATNVTNGIATALRAAGQVNVEVQESKIWNGRSKSKSSRTQDDKIAIVGMAGRFPGSADHEKLWDLLMDGLDVHREIPKERFNAQDHYDPSGKGKNKSHTPYGCFIDEPGLFDARFFNMSPREAAQTDPMARLALVTAYEALEMSGFVPNRTPSTKLDRIGTFYGQTSDDWREINAAEDIDTYFITGGVRAFAPGRINYHFKFTGPSYSVDTACSSSLAAIQLACTSLWAGDCDTACAGGVNVLTNPDIFSGLSKGQFLSKTGSCKTFDNEADGYCRGEGCGTIILKRYRDAVDDNDNILGCILNSGTNHSANAVSITHPHAPAQEFLYKKILSEAGVDAHDISYVEMHGTGTQAGDGIEMTSVANTFAPRHRKRKQDQPLYLGAIKANIGHGEAASGINSIIKCLLMFREGQIPPNVGIKGIINQGFPADLVHRQVYIPLESVPLPRSGVGKRKIFLNNFSAAGGNTAVLLEECGVKNGLLPMDPRTSHILTVTARSKSSLDRNVNSLIKFMDTNPSTDLASLSYTLTSRRMQHNHRISISVSDITQVRPNLLAQVTESHAPSSNANTEVIFAFTGQGTQYTGVGQIFYEQYLPFRNEIETLDRLALAQGLPSFKPLLIGSEVSSLSPVVIQLGLTCIQVALVRIWASWGVKPVAVIGHSLGEYAALHVAGVISANDMIRLVGHRARLVETNCTPGTHGMLAVKGTLKAISATLGHHMTEVACKNGPEDIVLCGPIGNINANREVLAERGFKTNLLEIPFAFHSAQVEPILSSFRAIGSSVVLKKPTIPILSPLTGSAIYDDGIICPEYLARHARETVDFHAALLDGMAKSIFTEKTVWLEVGAHPVCLNMIRNTLPYSSVLGSSFRKGENPWKTLTQTICTLFNVGIPMDFHEYHREFETAHMLLTLPSYSFDNKNYWLDYHHNWCLTKGEDPKLSFCINPTTKTCAGLSTTSCQQIIQEDFNSTSATIIVQSDITEPNLFATICGHMVNGAALCPSSIYADMALTLSNYIFKKLQPDAPPIGFNVCNMEVLKPLIAKIPPSPEGQHIQAKAMADLSSGEVHIAFRSVTRPGETLVEHGHCIVKFEDINAWVDNWTMIGFMVRNQVDLLRQNLQTGKAHKILRGMAYKLFQALVSYNDKFRGMEEVILGGEEFEATALVSFQADDSDGNYFCSPYWIDSLCHISGFIVNATDLVDSSEHVFISHGWDTMRFARKFSPHRKYRSYVRMLEKPNNVRAGDVYIFDGDEIIGVVGGIKFKEIPRRVLNSFLPPTDQSGRYSIPPVGYSATASVTKLTERAPMVDTIYDPMRGPTGAMASTIPTQASLSIVSKVIEIIARETDIDVAELVDETAFDNLGVDSLMSLAIFARFREQLELEISSTLFYDFPTIGKIKEYFQQYEDFSNSSAEEKPNSYLKHDESSSEENNSTETPLSAPSETSYKETLYERQSMAASDDSSSNYNTSRGLADSSASPQAQSVLLQGNPKTASTILFLFPDGSGSATSYASIPFLSPLLAVYGFNCPFMKNPRDLIMDFPSVCAIYIKEMKRRQPTGPYFIGGWSAGGVVAYEIALQLLTTGETVQKLILIDSPCPVALAPLPSSLFRFFDQIGLLGTSRTGSSPCWLVPHFEATVRILGNYEPLPMPAGKSPNTLMIWAKDGVYDKSLGAWEYQSDQEETKTMKWLLYQRDNFGDNGWGQLLGEDAMTFARVDGNHFSMMALEHATKLGNLIRHNIEDVC